MGKAFRGRSRQNYVGSGECWLWVMKGSTPCMVNLQIFTIKDFIDLLLT